MTYGIRSDLMRLIGLGGWIVTVLTVSVLAAGQRKGDNAIRLPDSPVAAAHAILAAWDDPRVGTAIDELGSRIAVEAGDAEQVLQALAQDASAAATTLRGELLIWAARGESSQGKGQAKSEPKRNVLPTARLGELAGAWLDHPDPFIRDLAEWAIAIRLGADYEGAEENVAGRRVARDWPGRDAPAWYLRWAALGPESILELDYVRQAAALGWHRNTAALLASAEGLVRRAEGLLVYSQHRGKPAQQTIAKSHMAQVLDAHQKLRDAALASPADLTGQRRLWLDLRRAVRQVVLTNPDIDFSQVLFATRPAAPWSGNITAGRWNTHTPGGDIYVKSGLSPADPVRPLLAGRLGPGHVRGLDLWWDADRLVFAFARQPGRVRSAPAPHEAAKGNLGGYFGFGTEVEELSHLFAVNLDGSGLRQLTDARYNADQEPAYLPNGDIVFVSDRSDFGSQCAGALEQDNMILNLYRCDAEGKQLRPLSNNKDFDRHPHVMQSGQVLFLHWEYQERHLWQTHTLWTCHPDGTMTDAIYKQHIETGPMSLREARQVWGQSRLAAIACGHHNYDQGAVFLVDYSLGINDRDGMRNVTPGVSGTEGGYGGVKPVLEGGVQDRGGHYMFPYPLSDKSFLVAYSYKRPERMAGQNYSLYYIDVWGNKELIHRDRQLSVAYLMPLRPTPRPPVLPDRPAAPQEGQRYAVACVANVQAGWPDEKVGKVKYLRISQKVPWPCVRDESKACGFNDLHWMPAAWESVFGMWDWGQARVIGIVPVEEDGSAHFKVPADQTVYFQALDENFLELRRMRSNVTFPAGETRTCIGCHESKAIAPPPIRHVMPLALRREPSMPEPPPWGDRVVPDYERHIQPIFERHCVRCHGEKTPDGGLEYTSRRIDGYMQSYRTLFGLKPSDPTPFAQGWWSIWRPNEAPLSDTANAYGRAFLRDVLRNPPPAQQVVVADYTGGAGVSQPVQFGSAKSKLTLTLVRDEMHRREVKLSRDQWLALVTWVDLNAQYWGTFVEKDGHFASLRSSKKPEFIPPPRRVWVEFPDPWRRPPAGEWIWRDDQTVILKP
jgi:hypothetical protein